jgi:hypothetical protein
VLVGEDAVDELHGDRAPSDRGGHAFDRGVADIARRQHARHARLEAEGPAFERPIAPVAGVDALSARGVSGVNFQLQPSGAMLERLADAVVSGRIVAPPITRIRLDDVIASNGKAGALGKTVITFDRGA